MLLWRHLWVKQNTFFQTFLTGAVNKMINKRTFLITNITRVLFLFRFPRILRARFLLTILINHA